MRTRKPSSSRFCQLFVCCALLLIVPTLLYLSSTHTSPKLVRDPRTGQWYTVDSLKPGADKDSLEPMGGKNGAQPALSQGNGADPLPPASAEDAQSWRLPGSLTHLDDILKNSWGSIKEGVNALGEDAKAALKAVQSGPLIGPAPKPKPPIMQKMDNATLRAELGRSTWKFLHTMTLRFPDRPTQEDRDTLSSFFQSFSRLYPCAECASHFQQLLQELPPQTSSRMSASLWLCSVHNRVNEKLNKPQFDCSKLDETYDCGCGGPGNKTETAKLPEISKAPEFEGLGANPGPGVY